MQDRGRPPGQWHWASKRCLLPGERGPQIPPHGADGAKVRIWAGSVISPLKTL